VMQANLTLRIVENPVDARPVVVTADQNHTSSRQPCQGVCQARSRRVATVIQIEVDSAEGVTCLEGMCGQFGLACRAGPEVDGTVHQPGIEAGAGQCAKRGLITRLLQDAPRDLYHAALRLALRIAVDRGR